MMQKRLIRTLTVIPDLIRNPLSGNLSFAPRGWRILVRHDGKRWNV